MSGAPDPPDPRVKPAFLEALEQDGDARARFLSELEREDAGLARQVRALLDAHAGLAAAGLERTRAVLGASLRGVLREPGQRLGDYELLEEVGEGAFGSVWRALQVSLDRIVALKLLRSGRLAGARDHARLRAEAEAVARLDHPNIVPIHEVGEFEGLAFFSMKWIEGGALADRLTTPWPARLAALLMVDVARAVHHAHQRGLLHRDLKPSNVLLDSDGVPHVADFGIAKRLDGESSATTTQTLAGTPAYMAPEQADGGELTVATDVWALGCILYELLTARTAFKGDSITDTLRRVRSVDPPRPRELRPDVPRDLETIVLVCLRKDPARRYPSANKLADDLERWLEHEPISARRTGALERLQLFAQRSPLTATLIGVVSALVLLLAFVATWASVELGARLRESYLGQARATRLAGAAGAREAALDLLRKAAAIRAGDDLRDETIACLALSDLRLESSVPRPYGIDSRAWIEPDFRRILLADATRASLVDFRTGAELTRLDLPSEAIYARWSPRGRWLFVKHAPAEGAAWSFSIWDARSERCLTRVDENAPGRSASFDPAERELVYVNAAGELVVLDLEAQSERLRLPLERSTVALAHHPDGAELALLFGDSDPRVEFRDARDGALLRVVPCVSTPFEIAWLGGGAEYALACQDAKLRVHSPASSQPRLVLSGHTAEVVDVLAHPTAPLLVSYSWDETTRVWDALTGRELRHLSARPLGFDPGDGRLATVDAHSWSSWRLQHGEVLRAARAHSGKSPVSVAIARDGATVATAGPDGLWVWRSDSSLPPRFVLEHELRSVAFVEDARVVACGAPDGLWRVDLEAPHEARVVLDGARWDVVKLATREALAVNGRDDVLLVDTRDWRPFQRLAGAPQLEFLSASAGGELVAAGCWRGDGVHLWSSASGGPPRRLFEGEAHVTTALSPDGALLATATGARFVLARVSDGAELLAIDRQRSFGVTPGPVAFSPDGARVAVSLSSDTIRLVEVPSLRVWGDLTSPTPDALAEFAFSPDGARIVVACGTNLIQVWDLAALERELAR